MIKKHMWAPVALSSAIALSTISLPAQASQCSGNSVAGEWAYTYTGSVFTPSGPLPAAALGHFRQDGSGKINGSQVRSAAGDTATEDISGSVVVKQDCTATATIDVFADGVLQRTAVIKLIYDSNRKHARMIFQSLTLPDGTNVPVVLTIDGNRLTSQD